MDHCRRLVSSKFLPLLVMAFFICLGSTCMANEAPANLDQNHSAVQQKKTVDLSGTWKLISFEVRSSGGEKTYPFGKNVKGMLIYTKGGHMSGKLMPSQRSSFASPDPMKGTPEEIMQAYLSFVGYYGTYEIDVDRAIVRHHVEGSLFPNWEGGVQERFFALEGNHLTLSTPPMPHGEGKAVGVLIWKRIE